VIDRTAEVCCLPLARPMADALVKEIKEGWRD